MTSPMPKIRVENAKNGTRRIVIPGARVVSTEVTIEPAAARRPSAMSTWGGEEEVDHVGVAGEAAVRGDRHGGEDEAAEPEVEAALSQARERDRPGTELERGHGEGDAGRQRERGAEHHPEALGAEQLDPGVGVEGDRVAVDPLDADQDVDDDGRQEAEEAAPDEQPADLLVIGGGQPIGVGGEESSDGGRPGHGVGAGIDGGHVWF